MNHDAPTALLARGKARVFVDVSRGVKDGILLPLLLFEARHIPEVGQVALVVVVHAVN